MKQKNGTNWAPNSGAPHNVGGNTPHGEKTVPRGNNVKSTSGNGGVNGTPRQPRQKVSHSGGRTNGQNGRHPNAPPRLTAEQIEARRKAEAKKKATAKRKRETFYLRLGLTLVIYLVLCLIIAGLIAILYNSNGESGKNYSLKMMLDEDKIYSADTATVGADGGIYIPVDCLSELCSITVAGDSNELLIYFHDEEQALTVSKDSTAVSINGTPVRLDSKVIFNNDDVKLPVELFERYVDGIKVDYDEDTAVCTVSKNSNDSVKLKLSAPQATPTVSDPEGTVSEEPSEEVSEETDD